MRERDLGFGEHKRERTKESIVILHRPLYISTKANLSQMKPDNSS